MERLDREGEISVGERLVLECEMPPLIVQRFETVAHHRRSQNHTVIELLRGESAVGTRELQRLGVAAIIGMALGAEPVKGAAHVDLLAGSHINDCQVDR